ncbi:MAG TPA: PAS domain S-box protein, partial [Nitrososphaerales archaeon]|nr:PAS domain S-box protein [Nitrososphaerales archaeon]
MIRERQPRAGGTRGDLSARLVALHRAAAKLASDTSIADVTNDTLDAMRHALGFDHADFTMVENGRLVPKAHRGKKSQFPVLELTGPGITVKAANRKKALLVPDTRKNPDYVEGWKGVRSELVVPVVLDGESVAVLDVESKKLNSFTKEDQELLETLASHVSSCMGRLRDERSLRQSEARMRGILNALPDLVFEMDAKGVYRDYYASDRNDLTTRPEAFIGKRMRKVLPPQVADLIEDAMERARKAKEAVVIEYQLPTLRGTIRDWEAHISRTGGGGCILIVRDITRRKRAEERLRQSEERYRSLIDGMLDGTYRTTHEGKVVDVNPAFVKMFGYGSKQEMLGIESIGNALYFSPEDRESQFLDTGQERT